MIRAMPSVTSRRHKNRLLSHFFFSPFISFTSLPPTDTTRSLARSSVLASVGKRTFFSCTVVSTFTRSKSFFFATLFRRAEAMVSVIISLTPVSPVSSGDLLQTAVESVDDSELVVHTGDNDAYSKGTLASLTNGTFGAAGHADGLCIWHGHVTYNLDTNAVPAGYSIGEMAVYTGWGGSGNGREHSSFSVLYRLVNEEEFRHAGAAWSSSSSSPRGNGQDGGVPSQCAVTSTRFMP